MRLVRKVSLVVLAPLLLVVLTLNRTGPLPAPTLPPSFDGATAAALTAELVTVNPTRVPGSLGAADAVRWLREKLALYGLDVREDRWVESVPGVGRAELVNVAAVVPGTLGETIVVVAHRDNNGRSAGANDNASGTAALIELARPYATAGTTESARRPLHTLVFLSTDAGAYGSLGAARFAARSPLGSPAVHGLLLRVADTTNAEATFRQFGILRPLTDREVAPTLRRSLPTDRSPDPNVSAAPQTHAANSVAPPGMG